MTKKEMLEAYRERVIELEELRRQIKRVGTDGRPSVVRTAQCDHISGTNDPAAAAMHLADGLEALAQRKEEELMMLTGPVDAMLGQIEDYRTFIVMQRYYKLAETDEQVAMALNMSRTRVNQLRHYYMKESA
jgi:hypothetical protein